VVVALELLEAYFSEFEQPAHGFFVLSRNLIAWQMIWHRWGARRVHNGGVIDILDQLEFF
jgi:hypothetical protein